MAEPRWIDDALVVDCAKCSHKVAGAEYGDGSGLCPGCRGAGFHVLAVRGTARFPNVPVTMSVEDTERP